MYYLYSVHNACHYSYVASYSLHYVATVYTACDTVYTVAT